MQNRKRGRKAARISTGMYKYLDDGHWTKLVVRLPNIANRLKVKKQVIGVKNSFDTIKSSENGFISEKKQTRKKQFIINE